MKETKDTKVYDIDAFRSAVIKWLSVGYDTPFTLSRLTLINKKKKKAVWKITEDVSGGSGSGYLAIENSEGQGKGRIEVWFSEKKGFKHRVYLT